MFQTKLLEEIKTHILGSITFFFFENLVVYEIMWKKYRRWEQATGVNTIWRIVFWIPKATNTHLQYVTLIDYPLQKWSTNASQCYVIRTLPVFFELIRQEMNIFIQLLESLQCINISKYNYVIIYTKAYILSLYWWTKKLGRVSPCFKAVVYIKFRLSAILVSRVRLPFITFPQHHGSQR